MIKKNQPNTYRKTKKLPWKKVPPAVTTRDTGHGRIESRTLKAVHVEKLGIDFPHLRQAIQLTRHRQNLKTGKMSHETVFVVTSLTSFQAGPAELAALIRGHWIVEAQHHIRDVSFGEDSSTSRTGHCQSNLATLRGAVINAIKDAGYLYIPEPPRPRPPHRCPLPPRTHRVIKPGIETSRRSPVIHRRFPVVSNHSCQRSR